MRICTWNINSVRIRLESVERLLKEQRPDILCLQEIKVANELFPPGLALFPFASTAFFPLLEQQNDS